MHKPYAALATLTLALGLTAGLGVVAPPPAAAAPYCGNVWGSVAESSSTYSSGRITDVRAGRHACFDRMVVDLEGDVAGYDVRYVPRVHQQGSGRAVPLAGGADLQVIIRAPAHTDTYQPSYDPPNWNRAVAVDGFRTFEQVAFTGSFEGQTMIGLGVRARLPFRVFVLDGPGNGSRLVVDVAHRW
ncbi:hypothetical protein AB0K08_15430 [Citricoccus sp. NPDC055426]|uniref:AMIN-like domain-containing (lipo)protein n=1 Tax=Citricoccus sp. NPDC055426 TaxID=3155536 RepID=UPI003434E8FE